MSAISPSTAARLGISRPKTPVPVAVRENKKQAAAVAKYAQEKIVQVTTSEKFATKNNLLRSFELSLDSIIEEDEEV